jgi:hypothetical protein
MAENSHRLPDLSQPDNRHEHVDINAFAIGKFGIGLVLLTVLAMLLVVGVFKFLDSMDGGTASRTVVNPKLPPAPTLETTPVQDLKAIRVAEEQILHSYGWVDQPKGVVRIPIDRAIDLLAQRGLPSRSQAEIPNANDVSVPTESGLGPKMQLPGGPLAGELK